MRYSLESFYAPFTAKVLLDLDLKYKASKVMPPCVASTRFILPVSISELKYFFGTSEMELGISFWTCYDFNFAKDKNSAGCLSRHKAFPRPSQKKLP